MARLNANALARLDRDRRALRLRVQGMPWPEVARECRYSTPNAALLAVKRLNRRETHEDVEMSRAIHRERIEMLMRPLWLAAINPKMAIDAAATAGQPAPPSQERAVELLRRLLDDLAEVEGTKAPRAVKVSGPAGGPIPIAGAVNVMTWRPDQAWMREYVQVLEEAGMLGDPVDAEVRQLGPGDEVERS